MTNKNNTRLDIQFLRALAVLVVIGYHFDISGFSGGFVGVDVFFVISGYLIYGHVYAQLLGGNFSLKRFFEARLRRIFPALAVVCAGVAIMGWYFVLPRDYVFFSRTVLAALCFVSNFAFTGAQGYFDAASYTKPLLHTWSLSIEVQFYFFLPLILIAIFKWHKEGRIRVALMVAALASFVWMLWLAYASSESGFYHVSARVWEFVAGAICATMGTSKNRFAMPLVMACIASLVMSVLQLNGNAPWPNAWAIFPVGSAAAFIYWGVNAQDNRIIALPLFQHIGDMSYSLYLWHWPVWVFYRQMHGDQISISEKVVLLLLTFVLAYLSWRWVEQPFRNRLRVTTKRLMTTTVVALICAMTFTAFVVISKGYSQRFPYYIARAAIQGMEKTPRGECFRNENNIHSSPEQFCAFGASSQVADATVMLWGDSHANMYLTPIEDASKALGRTGLIATMSGCRAFVENNSTQYPDFPNCKDFNREVFAYLLNHPKIKTIILGRIWSDSDETIDRTLLLIHQLISRGRKIVLIGPLPHPGMDVQISWAMQQVKAGHAIDEIKLDRSSQIWMDSVFRKLNTKLEHNIKDGNLFLLDPTRDICEIETCYIVHNGLAIFGDTSHLTEAAAKVMEPDFRKALISLSPKI